MIFKLGEQRVIFLSCPRRLAPSPSLSSILEISNKSVTILEHVDEDNQNRRPVVFDHQRRRGGQTNGETVFPRL